MANPFDSLIKDLQKNIDDLNKSEGALSTSLGKLSGIPLEIQEIISAFISQSNFTDNVSRLFPTTIDTTLEEFNSAINLVQLYFQASKPLPQILSNLTDGIESLDPGFSVPTLDNLRKSVKQILDDRQALQKTLNRVVQEFSSGVDDQNLQQLVKRSSTILKDLNSLQPAGFDDVSSLITEFITHLKKAQEFFKSFSQKGEDLTGNEPDEIQQLIRNWGAAISQIEKLEKGDPIKKDFNNKVSKSREAIAQSIKIHELLEQNYDSLTTLVRSGDLESAGIL